MDQFGNQVSLSSLTSSGIADHLDTIMINRILKGEFVELENLLLPTLDEIRMENEQLGTLVLENGCIVVKKKSCQIKSFDRWSSAFEVYMAVYLVTHPKETLLMLSYIRTLRKFSEQMTLKGVDSWLLYDKLFRIKKARIGTAMSWGVIDSELYALHILMPLTMPQSVLNCNSPSTSAVSNGNDIVKGTNGGLCDNEESDSDNEGTLSETKSQQSGDSLSENESESNIASTLSGFYSDGTLSEVGPESELGSETSDDTLSEIGSDTTICSEYLDDTHSENQSVCSNRSKYY